MKSILISAGGTGGGVYPALAVAETVRHAAPGVALHFVGSIGGMERGLVSAGLFAAYHEVSSGPLNGVGLRRAAASALKILRGTAQAWRLLGQIRPSLLFLTGGWATFPAALACWLRGVPIIIFLPDIEPALAIRFMSRLAHMVMVTTAESAGYFPKGVTVLETGYPLRTSVTNATRQAGIEHFKLDPARKTLMVSGGSRGANSLNSALKASLPDLLNDGLQVIHLTGQLNWPEVQALSVIEHYYPFAYLHDDMGLALAAADLIVSRAGASILGEFPCFGLPSILVPYPFAWHYQKVNADWLAARGAAIRLDDGALSALLPTIRSVIHDPARLQAMHEAAERLAHPDAADGIAHKLIALF